MRSRIVFNGNEYGTPDEMPPDIRAEYDRVMRLLEDRNGDGTPDVFESGAARVHAETRIYTDASRLTPADRQLFDQMQNGGASGNRITTESVFNVTFAGDTGKGWTVHLAPETRHLLSRVPYIGALLLLAIFVYRAWPR